MEKPLILIFPFDLLSHYLRCLDLVKTLKTSYCIRFAESNAYSDFIIKEGFQTFKCQSLDSRQVMECAKKFDFSWLNISNLEPVFLDQVKTIKELKPALVLGDTSPTLKMAAEAAGVKYISLMNAYMSKHYSGVRKLSRTHPAFKFSQKLPENVFDQITRFAESIAFYHVHRPFKKLRKKYRLKKMKAYLDELEGDLNLLCDLEELFPSKALPSNYKAISPLFHDDINTKGEVNFNLDPRKKTIFVSMGSTGSWEKVAFLNDHYFSKFNVIAAADNNRILSATHIMSLPFINVNDLFPHIDLVISHGGNGTIYQALVYGIPVLCKTALFEQEWNVKGLVRTGLGCSLDSVETLEDYQLKIEEWIDKKATPPFIAAKTAIARRREELHKEVHEYFESMLR